MSSTSIELLAASGCHLSYTIGTGNLPEDDRSLNEEVNASLFFKQDMFDGSCG